MIYTATDAEIADLRGTREAFESLIALGEKIIAGVKAANETLAVEVLKCDEQLLDLIVGHDA